MKFKFKKGVAQNTMTVATAALVGSLGRSALPK